MPHIIEQDNFLQIATHVRDDLKCANGLNGDCRKKQTDVLLSEWVASRAANVVPAIADQVVFGSNRIATNNDKIVSRCINGEWTIPSHSCLCPTKIAELIAIPNYWMFDKRDCPLVGPNGNGRSDSPTEKTREESSEDSSSSPKVIMTACGMIPTALYHFYF